MNNEKIAEMFENIADLLELKGEQRFTTLAYEKAARAIGQLPTELEQMVREGSDLKEVHGIGDAISKKITELVQTGKIEFYEKLRAEFPEGIVEMMHVPGLGPRTAGRLWKELGVENLDALEAALKDGRVAAMPRLGTKAAEKLLRNLAEARTRDARMPIARALRAGERMVESLRTACPSIRRLALAGSLRRYEETIGNIDLVCSAGDPQQVLEALEQLPNVTQRLGRTADAASVLLSEGIRADLRVVPDSGFGSALQFYTGNWQQNVMLRERAKALGLELQGDADAATGMIGRYPEEDEVYWRLGLQPVPPELRVGADEVDVAARKAIPRLVEVGDVRGDLHVHTNWTDGRDEMELMVVAARARGLAYVAITDHSVGRGIANGLSLERLAQHMEQVGRVEKQVGGIRVLRGTEMDIRADGSLDYEDGVLEKLDWVIGSIHSAMDQDAEKMTERIIRAMHSPHVDVIGHLTTRLIGERPPIRADFEAIFKAAAETGTALEINASPERLDLKGAHAARARELGVPLVISTDSHNTEAMDNTRFGVAIACRGWCGPRDILNTLPLPDFLAYLALPKLERLKAFHRHGR
ncbi:MAG: DNA polymerase/3'-5' exonuclease PolX [SAR202 cluster bacterium]|nr:DNA polymerase/3'-5' exonuclease PolX [SAR202 cluster bacterium]